MSRKFLTNIDLNSNELRNGIIHNLATDPAGKAGQLYYNTVSNELKYFDGGASAWISLTSVDAEVIEDAVAELLAAGSGINLDYNDGSGTLTVSNTGVTSIVGTESEVNVSASAGAVTISLPETIIVDVDGDITGNAGTATALETSRAISLGGSLSGSVSFDGTSDVTITADIVADSVALGTDTTGDYVAGASASGAGISVTGSGGEGSTLTIENTGVTSLSGTTNEVTVSASAGAITIGLPDDVTIGGDLVVTGDLTVSGSVTTLNTETLLVEDNLVTLNSNVTGTPAANAGIEIERGDSTNAELIWDESLDLWRAGLSGSVTTISLEGHQHTTSDVTGLQEYIEDTVGTMLTDSSTVDFTYSDNSGSAGTFSADVVTAATSYLKTASGLAVDIDLLEPKLVTDGFSKKYAVGNTSLTSTGGVCTWTVTHNLATKDVTVQVYEVAADYSQVEVDVQHTSTSAVTIKINSASTIAADTYRVVVIG